MKILAVLQNTWVREPARVEAMIARDPSKRRRIIAMLLFAGRGLTGKRLRAALGGWCERIEWENASTTIASSPREPVVGNCVNLATTLYDVQPHIVITFGALACKTLGQTDWAGRTIRVPHPTSGGTGVTEKLRGVRRQLDKLDSEDVRG
jgi:hypothetical protein